MNKNEHEALLSFEEFLKLWMNVPENVKVALEQFLDGSNQGLSMDDSINCISDITLRNEMRAIAERNASCNS